MALPLGRQPLSLTSYGYQPPPCATAHGWRCANGDCAAAGRRSRRRCRRCGSPVDPELDEPWAHEARGVQLDWQVRHLSKRDVSVACERLMAWRLKDALLREDDTAAAAYRLAIRAYAGQRQAADGRWSPGPLYSLAFFSALDLGNLDDAASDLCFWLAVRARGPSGEDGASVEDGASLEDGASGEDRASVEGNSVMRAAVAFLDAPGGAAHPRAAEIRRGCLRVASEALRAVG